MNEPSDRRSDLPRVNVVLEDPALDHIPHAIARDAVRHVLDAARAGAEQGEVPTASALATGARDQVDAWLKVRPRPVINATGVVIHTNLGRAPWAREAVEAVVATAGRYSDVELDLADGQRGGRGDSVRDKLVRLTGAQDALVVNNCAGAVLLALTALAHGREVVISRGELVEIGGSFRVPDILQAGGAKLVEVGTTNRTRVADFSRAVTPETAVLMKVHPSNFRMDGFVASVAVHELVAIAADTEIHVIVDLGSGALDSGEQSGVRATIADGADLVLFSGDKLLGGPQSGLIVGKTAVIDQLRDHPMMRALRVGKETLAALDATLALHLENRPTPVGRMLSESTTKLHARAHAIMTQIVAAGGDARVAHVDGRAGGGALPEVEVESVAVTIGVDDPDAAVAALRSGALPIVLRINNDRLLADIRTVFPEEDATLAERLATIAARR